MAMKNNVPIGEMLVNEKVITPEQLEACVKEEKRSGRSICHIVVDLGFAAEDKVLPILSKHIGIPYIKVKDKEIDKSVIEKVHARFAIHYKLMPLQIEGDTLAIAVTDPLDVHTLDDIKLLLGYEIRQFLGGEKDILEAIKRYYGIGAETIESIMAETAGSDGTPAGAIPAKEAEELVEDASIIKFVNQIIQQAYYDRATDIHIEPFEDELGPLQDRRHIIRRRYPADHKIFSIRYSIQDKDNVQPQYCRTPPAAGRQDECKSRRGGAGSQDLDTADPVRRERRHQAPVHEDAL